MDGAFDEREAIISFDIGDVKQEISCFSHSFRRPSAIVRDHSLLSLAELFLEVLHLLPPLLLDRLRLLES